MIRRLLSLFYWKTRRARIVEPGVSPLVLITESCQIALTRCLEDAYQKQHEGVAYLLGKSDGRTALCVLAVRPKARTTRGSFHVPASEMARIVAIATDLRLQIIAQVHTHPTWASHSDGDEGGANIRFESFVSIVAPDYGAALLEFRGCAVYVFNAEKQWERLPLESIRIVPSGIIQ